MFVCFSQKTHEVKVQRMTEEIIQKADKFVSMLLYHKDVELSKRGHKPSTARKHQRNGMCRLCQNEARSSYIISFENRKM